MKDDLGATDGRNKAPLPQLLGDGPAQKDDFGAHERIAKGMASLIQNQNGGHVIGLRGRFGSGKSTTVAELRKQLPESKWSLITFDAWTHRGYDLMRAFLATVIEQLSDEIGCEDAKRHRERIINQEEIQYTTSQSTVNIWGQWLIAIGIFAAAITAGLGATQAFGANAIDLPIISSSWLPWIGWLPWIAFWLLLPIGFLGPWPAPTSKQGDTGYLSRIKWIPSFLSKWHKRGCFNLRFFQEGERIHTTIKNSGAANSITFQEEFAKIVELAVAKSTRRIIVVLDNMDRLDAAEQLAAWSTVEAFVNAQFPYKERVWFVVPLSYIDDHEQEGSSNNHAAELREKLADKMFLTEYRVPDLVLTDWVAYVHKLCRRILQHADEKSLESVARVIISCIQHGTKRPRPRGLRAIVNQIGGLYHQWLSEVPLEVIALYVVQIQEVESKGETLSDEAIIADFSSVSGRSAIRQDNISRELAMIHFSAPRGKALQILVHTPFTKAMTTGQPLSAEWLSIPDVETLIDGVVREVLSEETVGSTILRMAASLDHAYSAGVDILDGTWALLTAGFARMKEPWQLSDDGTLEQGAEQLAQHYHPNREAFGMAFARQMSITLLQALEGQAHDEKDDDNLSAVIHYWTTTRIRLGLEERISVPVSVTQLYTLLGHMQPEEVASFDFAAFASELAEVTLMAMSKALVPTSLVEALEQNETVFSDESVVDLPVEAESVISNTEASLESKVSAAEIALLYCSDNTRVQVLAQLGSVLDAHESDDLPERTKLALGLVGALTGQYLSDDESDDAMEFLTEENLPAAIKLLNQWRLRGVLWKQVISSEPDAERDSLLRALHEAHPSLHYAGVQPSQFKAAEIPRLESRIGRSVLLHLTTQNELEAWRQYVISLDLGAGQLPLLRLILEGRPKDVRVIYEVINLNLQHVSHAQYVNNLTNKEDGYASLFELEQIHLIEWPDVFFDAAIDVLSTKGWIFSASRVPRAQQQRILSGVWSKVVSGRTDVPSLLLQDHLGPYCKDQYDNGAREEFTEKVIPAMISGSNAANLAWAVDFLFARHRKKSTIPEASDAQIQEAITRVYPNSQGDMQKQIERLASKRWFSLPSRPAE